MLQRIRAHVGSCPGCAKELEARARLRNAMVSMEHPPMDDGLVAADVLKAAAYTGGSSRGQRRAEPVFASRGRRAWKPALVMGSMLFALVWQRGEPRFSRFSVPSTEEIRVAEKIELFENLELIEDLSLLEWMAAAEKGVGETG